MREGKGKEERKGEDRMEKSGNRNVRGKKENEKENEERTSSIPERKRTWKCKREEGRDMLEARRARERQGESRVTRKQGPAVRRIAKTGQHSTVTQYKVYTDLLDIEEKDNYE